jgi:hypothetical protein
LEVGIGQSFPLVVNRGNGPDSHSLGCIHSLQDCTLFSARGMAQGGKWSRLSNQGQAFLRADSFSPGYTLFSVGGMAQGEEWSKKSEQSFFLV